MAGSLFPIEGVLIANMQNNLYATDPDKVGGGDRQTDRQTDRHKRDTETDAERERERGREMHDT